ncbi:type IV conjugative transfer system coupling protein TraD [Vibrio sp. S11_S32]|uniref:type IV conjugative transfer system coupling protein TraD n=1 Tax=Vibrio sp. S11_S32 TaxID=2720225 RepID=UPI001680601E|nr:type IV conjugative transfer system coupling protein TraD [Vibrio sp. S11_S32]MBD1577902.1 type IV conjugative transfer system coupling protein TraD [Vibrio sp. S11_S32]
MSKINVLPLLDGRMRPCYEYQASLISGLSAGILTQSTWIAGIPYSTAHAMALTVAAIGIKQYVSGRKLKKYHNALKNIDAFFMTMEELPVSSKSFWLGRGFEWKQKHTQRLYETQSPNGEMITSLSPAYKSARKYEHAHGDSGKFIHRLVITMMNKRHLFKVGKFSFLKNPLAPLPPVGGNSAIHGVGVDEEDDINIGLGSLEGHVLIMGTTGCGKTRTAEIFISSDIARKKQIKTKVRGKDAKVKNKTISVPDGTVVIMDPKGDADLLARAYSEAKRHGREFYFFHLGEQEITCRYNGIGNFSRLSECATRIAGQLSGSGDSSAFKEFAWRFIAIISRALFDMGIRPTYDHVRRYIMNMESLFIEYCEDWLTKNTGSGWREIAAEFSKEKQIPEHLKGLSRHSVGLSQCIELEMASRTDKSYPAYEGLVNAVRYDASYFSKITASLLPLLEKLCSGDLINILSPDYSDTDDVRPILDWTQAIRKDAVVYCGFAAMVDRDVASAVSNSMLSDLLSLSGKIYQNGINYGLQGSSSQDRPNIYLHMDEANEMCGDEFIPILNKARGSGVRVIAYTQAREDFEVRMGDAAKAGVVESNFNTLIMFRVKTATTAALLTDQLREVNVYDRSTTAAGSTDTDDANQSLMTTRYSDGVSITKSVPIISPDAIIALPKGQAFGLVEGNRLFKIRFPLPKETKNTLPAEMSQVYRNMKMAYQSYENWWEKDAA